MIVDTSALLAFFDKSEPDHVSVSDVIRGTTEPLVVSPYVVAELDYLIASRLGLTDELEALRELSGGAWNLPSIGVADLAKITMLVEQYGDLRLGAADASNVYLADRHRTQTIATLDHRHFRAVRPMSGGHFQIVP